MANVIHFIADHAAWFYSVCALGIVVFVVFMLRAQRNVRQSLFGLELEFAAISQRRWVRLIILTSLLAALVFLVVNIVEPNLPVSLRVEPTPTRDFLASPPPTFTNLTPTATQTTTPTLAAMTGTPAVLAVPEETLPAEEEATPEPTSAPTQGPGTLCQINSPADGSQVIGEITFVGSATTEQFLFYKLEAYGPQTGGVWASLLSDVVYAPVVDGVLGSANFGGWEPGGYSVRVVIVDATSNEIAGCYVSLTIASP